MAPPKTYLEHTPRGRPGERFSGHVPSPQELRYTRIRRAHLRSYFTFMRPEVAHMLNEYGKKAISKVCSELYAINVRSTPAAYCEFVVDRITWKLWFAPFGSDAPAWPWAEMRFPSTLAQGETPSRIYSLFVQHKQDLARHIALINEKPEDTSSTVPDPNAEFIVVSNAALINDGDRPPIDVDKLIRQTIWDISVEKPFAECNAVGPFEVEPNVPTEKYVRQDLAAINSFLPSCIAIKLNITNKRVLVTVVDGNQGENMLALRKPFLEVWEHVRFWSSMTEFQKETVTLLQHFQQVKRMGGLEWNIPTL